MKLSRIAFLLGLLLGAEVSQAQIPFSYTQYLDNLIPLNPAASMLDKGGSVHLLGRKQWVGLEGAPRTYMLNGHLPIHAIQGTAGLMIMQDEVAIEKLTEANAFVAKSVRLDPTTYLAVSLNFGVRRYTANYANLAPNDPAFVNSDIYETVSNAGFGVMVYIEDKFFAGVSLPRLTLRSLGSGSVEDNRYFRNNYYLTIGGNFPLGTDLSFKSAGLVAYSRNVPLQADVSGKFYIHNRFGIGANYRSNNELAGLLSVNVSRISLGYGYQFGFGQRRIGGLNNGTHELQLSLALGSADRGYR